MTTPWLSASTSEPLARGPEGAVHLADAPAALAWLAAAAPAGAALVCDSRRVRPGDVFVAWPGLARDARAYLPAALAAGASLCLVDAQDLAAYLPGGATPWPADLLAQATDHIGVLTGLKAAAGEIADAWLGRPSAQLDLIATTGTNGKTSTAWWTAQALSLAHRRCGVIGTLGAGEPPTRLDPAARVVPTGYTTPDPLTFHQALADAVERGCAAVALEASSIGLAEQRLVGARIRVALFTNFTPDHLDYHGDMASYWAAKRALFDWPGLAAAVVNLDDPQGAALAEELAELARGSSAPPAEAGDSVFGAELLPAAPLAPPADLELWTYSRQGSARLAARDLRVSAQGLAFTVVETPPHGPVQSAEVQTRLIGDYNVSNVLAVLAGLRALHLPLAEIAALASDFTPVPGRMQRVQLALAAPAGDTPALPEVVVDYAHTPDALEQALLALQPLARARGGRLVAVFGCGGNRDAGKRPVMGAIAARLADAVMVTSDNPRHEDPAAIVAQVLAGVPAGSSHVQAEVDRARAIRQVLAQADGRDVILLAGKGHEPDLEIAGRKRHFSDVEQARIGLQRRWATAVAPQAQGMALSLGEAAALLAAQGLKAKVVGDAALAVQRLHSDTRSLKAGDGFVALRGERFDAHDFLAQAQAAGAVAGLAERGLAAPGLPGLQVPDSLAALQQLAAAWRRERYAGRPLIAVTGSNGKTTVTQMIAAILRAAWGEAAHATAGNLNNHIGVPLTLLGLRPGHQASVVELGMNHPGEIAELAALARPTVALVNNAQREHQEFMATVEAVARENGSVLSVLPAAGGAAVYPAGDDYSPLWQQLAQGGGDRALWRFRLDDGEPGADVPAAEVHGQATWALDHWQMTVHTPEGVVELPLHIAGRHNARNALAATAAALAAGCPLAAVVQGLGDFRPVNGRSQVERLALAGGAVTLVNDSYNANPDSVRAAIDLLAELHGPRWLLLGDMGEVGDQGPAFHAEVGAYARERGIEQLWTAGALCAHAAQTYGPGAVHHADTAALVAALASQPWPATASVLVKGSRFMTMEQALAPLRDRAAGAAPASSPSTPSTDGGPAHHAA